MNNPLLHPATQRDMQIALMSLRTGLSPVTLPDETRIRANDLINTLEALVNMQQIEGVMGNIDELVLILDAVQIPQKLFLSIAICLANLKYMTNLNRL